MIELLQTEAFDLTIDPGTPLGDASEYRFIDARTWDPPVRRAFCEGRGALAARLEAITTTGN